MIEPQRCRAIIVGIESYEAGPTWNLNGPASDALGLLEYLHRVGLPKSNIRSFVAPLTANSSLHEEIKALSAETGAPTFAVLSDLFEMRLPEESCDMLFIYWSGHGCIKTDQKRYLFTADATTNVKEPLQKSAAVIV